MSIAAPLVLYTWEGDCFRPRPGFQKVCDRAFVVGETYKLEVIEDRSPASHRHFFASVNECWQNLPDHLAERFSSPDALRKYALIHAGFRDERSIVANSKAEALRIAAFVRPPIDEYAVVSVSGATVVVLTAKSQSVKAMGKVEFQRSKDAVLDILANLIGSTPGDLARAGQSVAA